MSRMYRDLAKYYDLIYSWKNYKKEALKVRSLIRKYKRSDGKELLDVGCGTGRHLLYLRRWFSCTGVDASGEMLKVAKKSVKGVHFKKADMTKMNLNKKFDIITSLFSAIGYAKTYGDLERAIKNFSRHLKKGGLVIVEAWLTPKTYKSGNPHLVTYIGKDLKIARLDIPRRRGNISVLDLHFLIGEKNRPVRYLVDHQELGLFSTKETLHLLRKHGFDARFIKVFDYRGNRGLFVCIKL